MVSECFAWLRQESSKSIGSGPKKTEQHGKGMPKIDNGRCQKYDRKVYQDNHSFIWEALAVDISISSLSENDGRFHASRPPIHD